MGRDARYLGLACSLFALACADGGNRHVDSGRRDGGQAIDAPMPPDDGGSGACEAVDCSALDGPCAVGTCDPADGSCDAVALADGVSCDDGDACTTGDVCAAGSCAGAAMDCSSLDSACAMGVCGGDGSCTTAPMPDGTLCDDANACTAGDHCASGACAGVATDCSALDGPCVAGACDPSTGGCVATPRADGTSCDDANACTVLDACASGACMGAPVSCSALDGPCAAGVCNPGTGGCAAMLLPNGTACDDGNAGTSGDVCTAGTCAGTPIGGCGGGALVPGRTDLVVGQGGWCVRCLGWSGSTCTHLQGRMDCSVCTAYPSCGAWHDVTDFNDSDNRSSVNWCALATGNAGIVSKSSGGIAVAPRACGWGSTVHPLCEAARASFHVPVTGVPTDHGALLNESYCSASSRLLYLDCAGW